MTSTLREVEVFIVSRSTEFVDGLHFVLVFDSKNRRHAPRDCMTTLIGM